MFDDTGRLYIMNTAVYQRSHHLSLIRYWTGSKGTFFKTLVLSLALAILCALPVVVHAVDVSQDETVDKAVEQAAEIAIERVAEKAAEKITEQAAEKAVEKAAGKVTEQAVEKAVEKAVGKAEVEATVKAEQKAKRPDEALGATKVHFFIYVIDVDEIDDANQNFTTNDFIRRRWKDPRLANPVGASRQVAIQEVWNPRLLLANRQGLVSKSLPEVVEVQPDGTVLYHQRYTGKLSQRLDLSTFPLDTHDFSIHFVAAGHTAEELEFVKETYRGLVGGAIAEDLSLPDWKISEAKPMELAYELLDTPSPGFAFQFTAKRYFLYYFWQVVLPLTVVVVMSWAAFWTGREHVGVRLGVATSSVLTLIAHRFVLANLLPRLPYMTRMDYFTVGCTLLVFLALIAVVMTTYFAIHKHHVDHARKVDIMARCFFPAVYAGLLLWFVTA